MKQFFPQICAGILFGLLGACNRQGPVDNRADALAPEAVSNGGADVMAGGAPPVSADADASGIIPVALQGRWGLTPGDCTTTNGDDKGLLTITGERLIFYESRAVPGTSIETRPDRISGNFDFTGEGQNWSKYVSLKLVSAGLLRTERSPLRSYTYARC